MKMLRTFSFQLTTSSFRVLASLGFLQTISQAVVLTFVSSSQLLQRGLHVKCGTLLAFMAERQ